MKKTINIILIIIWMSVIFIFSSMPSEESNEKSKATIKETIEIINNTPVSKQNESLSQAEASNTETINIKIKQTIKKMYACNRILNIKYFNTELVKKL